MLVPLHFYVRVGVLSPARLSAAGTFSLFEGERRPSTASPNKTLVAESGLDILPRSQLIKILGFSLTFCLHLISIGTNTIFNWWDWKYVEKLHERGQSGCKQTYLGNKNEIITQTFHSYWTCVRTVFLGIEGLSPAPDVFYFQMQLAELGLKMSVWFK